MPGMKSDKTDIPLLRTKLYRPPVPADHVHRDELLERLEKNHHQPLLLVSAPAGYGKSTLVSRWLETTERPGAWLSLDENDNDLRRFISYFVAAVQSLFPETAGSILDLTKASNLPPISVLAAALVNEVDRIDQEFIVVLDDIHRINDPKVYDFLNLVLRHPSRSMRLVVVGRRDPVLPIASLRARGLLTELRMRDLRFTLEETEQFIKATMAHAVEAATVVALAEKSEGWVTGLRLAVLAMRGQADPDRKLRELKGVTRYVMDYLISEVLDHQSMGIRDFLLNTSLLKRFCAPLCNALCETDDSQSDGVTGGQAFIDWLMENNLFVISLDTENKWFRYHHLFEELLRDHLKRTKSEPGVSELYARASAWFEEEGLIDESIQYALSANDMEGAADIVERHRNAELEEDRWYVVREWLDMLPSDLKWRRPILLLAETWIFYEQFQIQNMPAFLARVASLFDESEPEPAWLGEMYFLQGAVKYWEAQGKTSKRLLEKARPLLPEDRRLSRGLLELLHALSCCLIGQKEMAIRNLKTRISEAGSMKDIYLSRLVAGLFFIHLLSGDLVQARGEARRMRTVARTGRIAYTDAWSSYMEASTFLPAHDLDRALTHFSDAARERYILHQRAAVDTLAGLALTQQLMQDSDAAEASMDLLQAFARELNEPQYLSVARSARARLSLLQGDVASAMEWARSFDEKPVSMELFIWLEVPQITRARVFIAEGSESSLEQADELLDEIRGICVECGFTCQAIEAAVLHAMAIAKLGRSGQALAVLKEVVSLCESHGWIRPFVEAGSFMFDMLKQLKKKKTAVSHIEKILAVCREHERAVLIKATDHPIESSAPLPRPSSASQPFVEPLTHRELDVLEMLSKRLQNKEISEKLFISMNTVKSHLKNIFQKLHVENRRQAVKKAEELEILRKH